HARLNAPVSGHEQNRQSDADLVQSFLQAEPVEFGHAHVEQYATFFRAGQICQKLSAGFVQNDAVTGSPKQPTDRDAKGSIVVDDVDGCGCAGHAAQAAEPNTAVP